MRREKGCSHPHLGLPTYFVIWLLLCVLVRIGFWIVDVRPYIWWHTLEYYVTERYQRASPYFSPACRGCSDWLEIAYVMRGGTQPYCKLDDGWPESEEKYSEICNWEGNIWRCLKERRYKCIRHTKKYKCEDVNMCDVKRWRCENVKM